MKLLTMILIAAVLMITIFLAQSHPTLGEGKAAGDFFRCEITSDIKLAELKAKMVENCNLDKPFSLSQDSGVGIQSKYLICCHKK